MRSNLEESAMQGDTGSSGNHMDSSANAGAGRYRSGSESGVIGAGNGVRGEKDNGVQQTSSNTQRGQRGTLVTGSIGSEASYAASFDAGRLPHAGPVSPLEFELNLPANMEVNESLLKRYKSFCTDSGFTAEQAQRAVEYYMEHQEQLLDLENAKAFEQLQTGVWQGCFEERVALADHAVHVLDSHMEGRLKPMVSAGLGNNPAFAEAMSVVGELLSEDTFSPHGGSRVDTMRPMSTEEFLRKVVFNKNK